MPSDSEHILHRLNEQDQSIAELKHDIHQLEATVNKYRGGIVVLGALFTAVLAIVVSFFKKS